MGQQRGHQAQQQAKAAETQSGRSAPALNRTEDAVDAAQALLGSRAASRQWRNELQPGNPSRPLHQLLQSVATASPRVQAKPLFRGVSQEWGAATSGLVIQPKLTIGAPNDQYEQEADRVAQQVVSRLHSLGAETSQPNPTLQRENLPDDDELQMKSILQRDVDPEEDELQMKPLSQGAGAGAASGELETAIQQSRGGGQPLADSIRKPMEQAFGGVDFSGVKVHTDGRSDHLNRDLQAKAFTTGQDIYFRQGAYAPRSRGGHELLAHELTHVVQQNGRQKQRNFSTSAGKQDTSLAQSTSYLNLGGHITLQRVTLSSKEKKNLDSTYQALEQEVLNKFLDWCEKKEHAYNISKKVSYDNWSVYLKSKKSEEVYNMEAADIEELIETAKAQNLNQKKKADQSKKTASFDKTAYITKKQPSDELKACLTEKNLVFNNLTQSDQGRLIVLDADLQATIKKEKPKIEGQIKTTIGEIVSEKQKSEELAEKKQERTNFVNNVRANALACFGGNALATAAMNKLLDCYENGNQNVTLEDTYDEATVLTAVSLWRQQKKSLENLGIPEIHVPGGDFPIQDKSSKDESRGQGFMQRGKQADFIGFKNKINVHVDVS